MSCSRQPAGAVDRHGRFRLESDVGNRWEDGLGADNDDPVGPENGARCSEQVFEIASFHAASLALTDCSALMRSASVITPANGVI